MMNTILCAFALLAATVSGHGIRGTYTSTTPTQQLNGTQWTAVEISFDEDTSSDLQLIPTEYPITLSFDSGRIYGSTGCNRYFGKYGQPSDDSFSTGRFGLTKKLCRPVMEQERSYMKFFSKKTFFFEINNSTGQNEDELVLFDNTPVTPERDLLQETER
eukprot:184732_1